LTTVPPLVETLPLLVVVVVVPLDPPVLRLPELDDDGWYVDVVRLAVEVRVGVVLRSADGLVV
jgi:hypothetical protein